MHDAESCFLKAQHRVSIGNDRDSDSISRLSFSNEVFDWPECGLAMACVLYPYLMTPTSTLPYLPYTSLID